MRFLRMLILALFWKTGSAVSLSAAPRISFEITRLPRRWANNNFQLNVFVFSCFWLRLNVKVHIRYITRHIAHHLLRVLHDANVTGVTHNGIWLLNSKIFMASARNKALLLTKDYFRAFWTISSRKLNNTPIKWKKEIRFREKHSSTFRPTF